MNRYYRFFLSKYSSSDLETRKRTRVLLTINSFICFVIFLNIVLIEIPVNHDFISAAMEAGLILLLMSCFFFLRKGMYSLSSSMSIVILLLGMGGLGFVNPLGSEEFKVMQLGFLLSMIIVYACLVGYKKYQIITATLISEILVVVHFKTNLLTVTGSIKQDDKIAVLVLILVLLSIIGVMSFFIMKTNQEVIQYGEMEARKNQDEVNKLQLLLKSFKTSMAIGENLIQSSGKTMGLTSEVCGNLQKIQDEADTLNGEILNNLNYNKIIAQSAADVQKSISEQKEAVNKASSSVEEINSIIKNISNTAQSKKNMIIQLVESTKEGEKEMALVQKSIQDISDSARKMMDMNKVILNIAEQTKILSMNAAIESAHAGEFGKGFSIVAEEVRTLSEETDLNSKMITDALQTNLSDLDKAIKVNIETLKAFKLIKDEVNEVVKVMDDILKGLGEVSSDTETIVGYVSKLIPLSGSIYSAVQDVDGMIREGNLNNDKISGFSGGLKQKLTSITDAFDQISVEMAVIDDIGKKNQLNITSLEQEISRIITA